MSSMGKLTKTPSGGWSVKSQAPKPTGSAANVNLTMDKDATEGLVNAVVHLAQSTMQAAQISAQMSAQCCNAIVNEISGLRADIKAIKPNIVIHPPRITVSAPSVTVAAPNVHLTPNLNVVAQVHAPAFQSKSFSVKKDANGQLHGSITANGG